MKLNLFSLGILGTGGYLLWRAWHYVQYGPGVEGRWTSGTPTLQPNTSYAIVMRTNEPVVSYDGNNTVPNTALQQQIAQSLTGLHPSQIRFDFSRDEQRSGFKYIIEVRLRPLAPLSIAVGQPLAPSGPLSTSPVAVVYETAAYDH